MPGGAHAVAGGSRPLAGRWLLFGAIVAVGLNLRGPIVAVAPVLGEVQRELQITETAAGLLTSVPVLCFAAVSPFVAALARRIGSTATVAVSVAVLMLGLAVRPWGGFALMLAGTVLVGAAIACNNVLLPAIVRRDFAHRPGPVLSAVTTSLLVSASIPALLTAPLASVVGWRAALATWAGLTGAALAIWWLAAAKRPGGATGNDPGTEPASAPDGHPARVRSAWRVPAAWELGLLFGAQSSLFFATTAWLPTMLQEYGGLDSATAGTALSLFQLLGIAGAITVPVLLRGRHLRYVVVLVLAALWMALFAGLLLAPVAWPLWCVLGGVSQGGGIALALSLIAMRSETSDAARTVSGMVQAVGYCLGATSPVVIGALAAATLGWTAPFLVLIVLSAVLCALGLRAAAPRYIR